MERAKNKKKEKRQGKRREKGNLEKRGNGRDIPSSQPQPAAVVVAAIERVRQRVFSERRRRRRRKFIMASLLE